MIDSYSPVLTENRAREIAQKVLSFSRGDTALVELVHSSYRVSRIANNRILAGNDGDTLELTITTNFGARSSASLSTNQIDDASLREAVRLAESIARMQVGSDHNLRPIPLGPKEYIPVNLWREPTVEAMRTRPGVLADIIEAGRPQGLLMYGFVGMMARSAVLMNKDGLNTYYRETDCECTVTARTPDGKTSGWHGEANRDWSKIDPRAVALRAADVAKRSLGINAVEPGRRIAILSPMAVAQLLRTMTQSFDAFRTDSQQTPFSKRPDTNRRGERVFDTRLNMYSDPADPDGGYRPDFAGGLPQPRMTWIKDGVLVNLAYDPIYSMTSGNPYAGQPASFRVSGGTKSIEDMITSCKEGIYVNHVGSVAQISGDNGMLTGVTRNGCFLVKDGKINRPVKNFRFTDSPWFFLNRIEALGVPVRAAFGYAPPAGGEPDSERTRWPRPPVIVPPMMVSDFNFTALADAI